MKIGDRVEVRGKDCSFLGMRGDVTQTSPFIMVLLEGERLPMLFGETEVIVIEEPQHVTGGG